MFKAWASWKNVFYATILCFVVGVQHAAAKPFLWQAVEPQSGHTLYLFGTIHSGNPEVNQLHSQVIRRFNQSKTFLAEIDLSPANQQSMQQQVITEDAAPLKESLGSQRVARVQKVLKRMNPQLDIAMFSQLPLWAFVTNMSFLEDQLRYPGAIAMDARLFAKAMEAQKQTGGLETFNEQISIFTGLSTSELLVLLDTNLDEIESSFKTGVSPMDKMYAAYLAGDASVFKQLMDEQVTDDPVLNAKLTRQLITDRNQKMADRLVARIGQLPQPVFVAIGAAHLAPNEGVQSLLADKGWIVTRLAE